MCDYAIIMLSKVLIFVPCTDDNKDGFHVSWDNGSYTSDCLRGLETLMIFECDYGLTWPYSTPDITSSLLHINYDKECLVSW